MSSDARSLRSAPDEGFHEIHLSGKQLVFLFMATTLVSIVIFLCGVLVGRGARTEPILASEFEEPAPAAAEGAAPQAGEPVIDSSAPAAARPEPGQPTPVESGDFNYFQMLTAEQQANEVPQPPAEDAGEASPATPVAAPPEAEVPAEAAPAAATAAAPASSPAEDVLTIQVTALKERAEADRVASRLKGRGYEAYVAEPAPGTSMYRVRVGRFTDRAEAERVKTRLSREEKFKPWITR